MHLFEQHNYEDMVFNFYFKVSISVFGLVCAISGCRLAVAYSSVFGIGNFPPDMCRLNNQMVYQKSYEKYVLVADLY